ncbi:putative DUF3489 domain-containing protein [uncultured Gammaproteobacteria bacterium]
MTTRSDLTLAQLTAIYSAVSGKTVGVKFFNSKATGVRRVEALLAEGNVTLNDAFRAAEIEFEPEPAPAASEIEIAHDGREPEQTALSGEDDIHGGEFPPEDETPPEPEAAPAAEMPEPLDAAAILTSNRIINDTRDWLVRYLIDSAGLDPETAVLAALRAVAALKLPEPATRPEPAAPRQPRTGSKQDQVIVLLRRPEGATLAQIGEATGWAAHTCRGVLAGALKKRLGLTVTSTKEAGGQRVYRLTAS